MKHNEEDIRVKWCLKRSDQISVGFLVFSIMFLRLLFLPDLGDVSLDTSLAMSAMVIDDAGSKIRK